jgi:GLPGLI family protein
MKKSLFFILFTTSLLAQEVTFKYKITTNFSFDKAVTSIDYTMQQNDVAAIIETDNIIDTKQFKYYKEITLLKATDSINAYNINEQGFLFLAKNKQYKDFRNNIQILHDVSFRGSTYLEDNIDIFNWEILNEKDTLIADFNCKKAITKFRGRDYVAYYSNEIANHGGPWKFDGLPGFILKVNSKDGYVSIEPTAIIINNNEDKVLKNPFGGKKTILFKDLAAIVIEKEKKVVAKRKADAGGNFINSKFGPHEGIEDIGLNGTRVYE